MVSEDKTANTYLLFLNLFSYYHLFFSKFTNILTNKFLQKYENGNKIKSIIYFLQEKLKIFIITAHKFYKKYNI